MPDLGWTEYTSAQELSEWLGSLTVSHTVDEWNEDHYYVEDYTGTWIGESFPSADLARDEIQRIREEYSK